MPKLTRDLFPRNSRVTEHICKYCEIQFFSNKPKTKYCSDKCRVYFHLYKKEQVTPDRPSKEVKEVSIPATAKQDGSKLVVETNHKQKRSTENKKANPGYEEKGRQMSLFDS